MMLSNKETKEWREYTLNSSPIGKGMYSKVYYGVHRETGREIALKKIFFNQLQNKIKDRIITEINILQRLDHKNIIKLYDYKFDGEYILLIMEYCNGGDLKKWMKNSNNEEEILKVLRQIISSIEYLHKNGVMHRDIKPENIIFHNNEIKICDFGFSTLIKDNTELFDTMCGTPLYMSPEILFLQKYNIYSEIWSLGVLFYTILFKKHPFGDLENIEDYRNKIREKFIIEFNEKDTEYKEESILKIIQTTKNMLSYDYNNRPSIHHIHSFINNDEIRENNPYIGPILCNNFIDVNGRLVSPFGSYNSPVIGPVNSPSSPVLFNPNNTPYRKSSSFDIHLSKRIEDLEEKVNKIETLVSSSSPKPTKDKDENNIDMFELNEEYFYKKEEDNELYEEESLSKSNKSKPIKIKNFNQSNSSFVGSIYNFIAKSF